jgi:uncharacterized protein
MRGEPIRPDAPDLASASLAEIAALVAARKLPPVDQWNPAHCGYSDMAIAADGQWFHSGSPIGRLALVKLFAGVLRREADGSHVLVTPVEKLSIAVADAAFVAVAVTSQGTGRNRVLAFRTNVDDVVLAGPDHPLRFARAADGTPRPYLHVRGAPGRPLEALINRATFYQLADWAIEENPAAPGLWSGGAWFDFAG